MSADYVVDMGPGAGVARRRTSSPRARREEVMANSAKSLTGKYLSGALARSRCPSVRREPPTKDGVG